MTSERQLAAEIGAALARSGRPDVKIAKFEDDAGDISIDGRVVGWLERVKGERFRSASSRARESFVSHYTNVATDDALDAALTEILKTDAHDFESRSTALAAIRAAIAKQRSIG